MSNSHKTVTAADAHAPAAHASTHESGGSDEIDVTGLTGAGGGGGSGAPELPIDAAATAAVGSGDLFGGTSLDGGWSSLQSTALTSNDASVDGYLIQKNTGNTGGADRGIQRAFAPSGDFTVYAKLAAGTWKSQYQWAGLFVGAADPSDGGSGNRIETHLYYSGAGGTGWKFSKLAAGSETNVFDAAPDLPQPGADIRGKTVGPLWYRIRRSGTTMIAGISYDGISWYEHATTTTISFTVATIGLYTAEATATIDLVNKWAYIATTG